MKIYNSLMPVNKLSKIFQPRNVVPENANIKKSEIMSKSQRLMLDLGIIKPAIPGCFCLLPFGLRAMQKLINIVDTEMMKLDAQKVILPSLTSVDLWKTTGRLSTTGKELFVLEDRHNKKYVLSPTQEEAVCDLLASLSPLSYKHFPLRLYQVTSKYRDEIKPRFGLMRGRQFLMKDLYTFDIDMKNARDTYEQVCAAYNAIFDKIGIKYVKVLGTTGNIGGSMSHEYHYPAEIGEDQLLLCENCNYIANVELCGKKKCPQCNNSDQLTFTSGIEVGHTFLLGDKYSSPLNVKYLGKDGRATILQMGCYGLGLNRILAASIEVLSRENEMRWPLSLAPYNIFIIPPKAGSKEEAGTTNYTTQLYTALNSLSSLENNILIDDRSNMTIGKRLFEAYRFGYPFIIVIGNLALQNPPLFELHDLICDTRNNFTETELKSYIKMTGVNTQAIERSWLDAKIRILKKMRGVPNELFQSYLHQICWKQLRKDTDDLLLAFLNDILRVYR